MFGGSPQKIKKSARSFYELIPGKKPSAYRLGDAIKGTLTASNSDCLDQMIFFCISHQIDPAVQV